MSTLNFWSVPRWGTKTTHFLFNFKPSGKTASAEAERLGMCVPYSILRFFRLGAILGQVRSQSYDIILEVMFDAPTVIFYASCLRGYIFTSFH